MRPASSKTFNRRKLCGPIIVATTLSANAWGGPAGGNIVGGEGSIDHNGLTTTIHQSSERLAIDWDSFNVDANEHVEFIQPGSDAIAFNRVLGNDASHIFGQLEANGQVVLVNPNGLLFGEGATVNVGGLVASGLAIDPAGFMNGELLFKASETGEGFVINRGLIHAATGGNVALVGKRVANEGLIEAKLGSVALAAGREAVLTFDAAGLIGVKVTGKTLENALGGGPALTNSGDILAGGGRVLLTASESSDVFSQAVNAGDLAGDTEVLVHPDGSFTLGQGANLVNSGEIHVTGDVLASDQPSRHAGSVVMLGEDIQHTGRITAANFSSNRSGGEVVVAASGRTWLRDDAGIHVSSIYNEGGRITLLGRQVGLTDNTLISATGGGDGGTVVIGGRGTDNASTLKDTEIALVGEDVRISANGDYEELQGKGGRIEVWSSTATLVDGHMEASGYDSADRGGTVVIASDGALGFNGSIDIRGVVDSENGTLVLQGEDLSVTKQSSLTSISEAALNQALSFANLVLQAEDTLSIDGEGDILTLATPDAETANRLTLEAGRRVTIRDSEIRLGIGDIEIDGGNRFTQSAAGIEFDNTSLITSGHLLLSSASDIVGNSFLGPDDSPGDSQSFAGVTVVSEADIDLAFEQFVPSLTLRGDNVRITAQRGFAGGEIESANLHLTTLGTVEATANVSGTAHLHGLGGADMNLTGDFYELTATSHAEATIHVTDINDLLFGDLDLSDSNMTLTSLAADGHIYQAYDSKAILSSTALRINASEVTLGALGSSSILLGVAGLYVDFAQNLSLQGLIDYSDYGTAVRLTGSDMANTVQVTETAELKRGDPLYENALVDLGAGEDTLLLSSDFPIPLTLGAGVDLIHLHEPGIEFNAIDFDPAEDQVIDMSP